MTSSRVVSFAKKYPRYATYCAVWTVLFIGSLVWGFIYVSPWFPVVIVGIIAALTLANAIGYRIQRWAVRRDEADQ